MAKKKKAKKRRLRKAARGVGRRVRRALRRRRPQMGLIGKAGVGVAGGVPIAFAGIEAIDPWTNAEWAPYQLATKIKGSLAAFTNTLTSGFGLGAAVTPSAVAQGDPLFLTAKQTATVSGLNYAGAWFKTTAAGVSLVVIDGVIGLIARVTAGGRTRPKIMGKQMISG